MRTRRRPHAGYHHGDLRNALTAAATELARAGGPEAVVLREATRRVGVSPAAAYRHFATQRDLLAAVQREARAALDACLADGLAASVRSTSDPLERLKAFIASYLRFARAEPGLFRMASHGIDGAHDRDDGPAQGRFRQLLAAVLDGRDGRLTANPAWRAAVGTAAWALVHGLALHVLDGHRTGASDPQIQLMTDVAVRAIHAGGCGQR